MSVSKCLFKLALSVVLADYSRFGYVVPWPLEQFGVVTSVLVCFYWLCS